MANTFKKKPFSSMYQYQRPGIAYFTDINGDLQESPKNVVRFDYRDGYLWGIRFGDGDSMRIPLISNAVWKGDGVNMTFVVTANAPDGYTFFRCGSFEIQGSGTLKTTFHNVNTADLADEIHLFENTPNFTGGPNDDAHVLIVKYYHEDVDFESMDEYQSMEELNTFLHGPWGLI